MTRRLPLPLHLAAVALLLVAAVGLASCAEDAARSDVGLTGPATATAQPEPGPADEPADGADGLVGDARQAIGQWVLLEGTVDGEVIAVPGGEQITMEITRTQVVGASACNQYSATATIDGGEMTVDAPTTTRMLCADDAMAAESAYVDGLQRITSLDSDGEELVLTGDGVELRFVAA